MTAAATRSFSVEGSTTETAAALVLVAMAVTIGLAVYILQKYEKKRLLNNSGGQNLDFFDDEYQNLSSKIGQISHFETKMWFLINIIGLMCILSSNTETPEAT